MPKIVGTFRSFCLLRDQYLRFSSSPERESTNATKREQKINGPTGRSEQNFRIVYTADFTGISNRIAAVQAFEVCQPPRQSEALRRSIAQPRAIYTLTIRHLHKPIQLRTYSDSLRPRVATRYLQKVQNKRGGEMCDVYQLE